MYTSNTFFFTRFKIKYYKYYFSLFNSNHHRYNNNKPLWDSFTIPEPKCTYETWLRWKEEEFICHYPLVITETKFFINLTKYLNTPNSTYEVFITLQLFMIVDLLFTIPY